MSSTASTSLTKPEKMSHSRPKIQPVGNWLACVTECNFEGSDAQLVETMSLGKSMHLDISVADVEMFFEDHKVEVMKELAELE